MTEDRTPATEAGRAMLRDPLYQYAIGHILAIEAEARADALREPDVDVLARAMERVNNSGRNPIRQHGLLAPGHEDNAAANIVREYRAILDPETGP